MPTHREHVIALRDHAETPAELRNLLEPFIHEPPATAPPADEPHAHASMAGTSACSVCGQEARHRLHRAPAPANTPKDPPNGPPKPAG